MRTAFLHFLLALGAILMLGATPMHRQVIRLALDDSPHSQELKSELDRLDWTKPSPGVSLRDEDKQSLVRSGTELNRLSEYLHSFRYVSVDPVLLSEPLHPPAIQVGVANWQQIDARAFRYRSLPLRSLHWYVKCHFEDEITQEQKVEWKERESQICAEEKLREHQIKLELMDRNPRLLSVTLESHSERALYYDPDAKCWKEFLRCKSSTLDVDWSDADMVLSAMGLKEREVQTFYVEKDVIRAHGQAFIRDGSGRIATTRQTTTEALDLTGIDTRTPEHQPPFMGPVIPKAPFLQKHN